jgi:hypothetical protein
VALTKTGETTVYAIADTASNTVSLGTALDVSTYYAGYLRIRLGRSSATAFTVGPRIRIEGTGETGTPTAQQWTVLASFQMAVGASIGSQAVSGTEAAGQTTITLAAATNFAASDYVFFHNTTLANSEWARVVSVSGSDIVIEEGIVNAQTGATARDQAEHYPCQLDLIAINKLRIVVDNSGTGQSVVAQVIGTFNSGL